MKIIKTCLILTAAGALMTATGCKDFLHEVNISNTTTDTYYPTEQGFEDLVRSCYPLLRGIIQQRDLQINGTDVVTDLYWNGGGAVQNALNGYDGSFTASQGALLPFWTQLYQEIGRCNTVISRSPNVQGMDPDLLAARVGEAKFLRAYSYFHLVQQWGDVPMPLTETTSATKEATRTPSADVYQQIIQDLKDAESALPVTASDYGRATKGAAEFLLSKVYLTRGWNYNNALGGTPADFQSALEYADKIIAAYPLAAKYSDLFPQHSENPLQNAGAKQNDKNPEIIFAVQYSDDDLTNTNPGGNAEPGNDAHSIWGGEVESVPGYDGRTPVYNRFQETYIITPAMYRMFSPQLDTRYQWDFVDAQYAIKAVDAFHPISGDNTTTIQIKSGDTVVLFRPWNDSATLAEKGIDAGGTKHYAVFNVTDFFNSQTSPFMSTRVHPMMWKFWQPNIPYGDAYGTLDQPVFRSAEAYLIAAEAILKGATGGALGGADIYYNKVLDRALGTNAGATPYRAATPGDVHSFDSVAYRATPGNLTIDMILDERARELLGENVRWYDLKRTGTLIARATAMNPWTKHTGTIDTHHLLRPIPQQQLDLSSPKMEQNPGY